MNFSFQLFSDGIVVPLDGLDDEAASKLVDVIALGTERLSKRVPLLDEKSGLAGGKYIDFTPLIGFSGLSYVARYDKFWFELYGDGEPANIFVGHVESGDFWENLVVKREKFGGEAGWLYSNVFVSRHYYFPLWAADEEYLPPLVEGWRLSWESGRHFYFRRDGQYVLKYVPDAGSLHVLNPYGLEVYSVRGVHEPWWKDTSARELLMEKK